MSDKITTDIRFRTYTKERFKIKTLECSIRFSVGDYLEIDNSEWRVCAVGFRLLGAGMVQVLEVERKEYMFPLAGM